MKNIYQAIQNWTIPASYKSDLELHHKSLFAFNYVLLTLGFSVGYFVYYICLGYWFGIAGMILAGFATIVYVLMLKYQVNLNIVAHYYAGAVMAVIGLVGLGDGGINSPCYVWYAIGIFGGFWIGDMKVGFIWSFVYLIFITVLYCLFEVGFLLPDEVLVGEYEVLFKFLILFGVLSFMSAMAVISEVNRKSLQDKLNTSRRQLIESEKMASLGQLTAGIAHEINNPINFVQSNAQALVLDVEELKPHLEKIANLKADTSPASRDKTIEALQAIDPVFLLDEMETLANSIKEGSKRVEHIVASLRVFAHQSEEIKQMDDLNHNLETTLTILGSKLKQKNISVKKQFGEIPMIQCFPNKISQVFMNIIDNAIHALSESGHLEIQTKLVDDWVVVKIQDDGAGMDQVTRTQIFNPFFTTKKVGEGMGLGLSISYGVIEQHGGRIKVNSAPGKGTEFVISLPVN